VNTPDTTSTATRSASNRRALAVVWLVAALVTAPPGWLLFALSDGSPDRWAGVVLLALTVAALALATWLLRTPARSAQTVSLVLSAAWLFGAVVVYPTLDFASDALWAAGVPLVAALVTGALAWWGLETKESRR
jgi:peptidoglycan/LPS O-acetylase OafA/YrhL